jgi:hypothetical protein
VEFVRGIGPEELGSGLRPIFRLALAHRGLALLAVRTPCPPPGDGKSSNHNP